MYTPEQIFVIDFEEMENALHNQDERSLFKCAAILRRMFLDTNCVYNQVNRNIGHKIKFVVLDTTEADKQFPPPWSDTPGSEPIFMMRNINLDPAEFPHLPINPVNKDRLLSMKVLRTPGGEISVRDYIIYLCVKAGAVHKGEPDEEKLKQMEDVASYMFILNVPAPLAIMRDLIDISLKALRPVYDKVKPTVQRPL